MTKRELLNYLAEVGEADASEIALALEVSYPVAAMALLRLVRQGLASRFVDPDRGIYWYRLSDRGQDRLAHLRTRS
ncbi:MAG: ArsR family transcriptional regulator [Acidobacteria bacterium]|nr:ArsR family transcriptional regulator [Acidobacteriota bacterium]